MKAYYAPTTFFAWSDMAIEGVSPWLTRRFDPALGVGCLLLFESEAELQKYYPDAGIMMFGEKTTKEPG